MWKRLPADVYKTQKRGGRGVSGMTQREDDFVEELFISSTHDHVLFITNKGKMHRLKWLSDTGRKPDVQGNKYCQSASA